MGTSTSKNSAAKVSNVKVADEKVVAAGKKSLKSKTNVIDNSRLDAPGLEPSASMPSASMPHSVSIAPLHSAGARCIQCGKTIRAIPFALNNIVCRNCDGADRGRRVAALLLPDKSAEILVADVSADSISSEDAAL